VYYYHHNHNEVFVQRPLQKWTAALNSKKLIKMKRCCAIVKTQLQVKG